MRLSYNGRIGAEYPCWHLLLVQAFETPCDERMPMIDIENERVIPLREVPKHVPSRCVGKRLSPATVWRWAMKKNNPLETIQIGGGRYTSIEAIARFADRGTTASPAATNTGTNRSNTVGNDRAVTAGAQLRKLIDPKRNANSIALLADATRPRD